MNQKSQPAANQATSSAPAVVLWFVAIIFLGGWLLGAAFWFSMTLMAAAMANDSGSADSSDHSTLLIIVLVGDVIIGLAGLPGALAFVWRGRRKILAALSAAMCGAGCVIQLIAAALFLNAAR